jgi:hypothetical protein
MRLKSVLWIVILGLLLAGCGGVAPQDREVGWDEAIDILSSGEVVAVYQLHSLKVTLELDDGSSITTWEPRIDEIFREVDRCGSLCQGILLATE